MATVLIITDHEEGHLLSTMGLARSLRARQHRVCYTGIGELEQLARQQGFEFFPIMQELMLSDDAVQPRSREFMAHCFKALIKGTLFDRLISELKPDILLCLCYYDVEVLALHYRYNLPVAIITPMFRNTSKQKMAEAMMGRILEIGAGIPDFISILNKAGVKLKGLNDLKPLFLQIPEIVLLPTLFQERSDEPFVYWVGTNIDTDRVEGDIDIPSHEGPLIFCTLGSQPDALAETSYYFFQRFLDMMVDCQHWRAIVSIGKRLKLSAFPSVPPNVLMTNWAPQVKILSSCSAMVTHAGIGTVKECMISGVPMLLVPLMRDQFHCADQVCRLGIGLQADIETTSSAALTKQLNTLIMDSTIRQRVKDVQTKIRSENDLQLGAGVIEDLLTQRQKATL
jgi:zeaxanthin glucosyltransferase